MSAADGLPRKEEDGSAILSTLTISGRQADTSWLHLSRKQDRLKPRSEHYRRLPPFWPCANTQPQPSTKGNLCDLLSVTKASCSIARATNQIESSESDRRS